MADNSYSIETKLASKNGWHTPAEAKTYYGRYSREGVTVHWWGDGTGAGNHDNIVNYMNNQAAQGNKSVNYVLSDNKITLCVGPDNVAWTSNSGNPTTISVETQPTLGNEGYKKWGWLLDQLEQRYDRTLKLYKHSDWVATSCPGSIDLNRIRAEADKWKRGEYDKPTPVPPITGDKKMTRTEAEAIVKEMVYLGFLKREGDAGGIKHYVDKMMAGNYRFIGDDVTGSKEFKDKYVKTVTVEKPVLGPVQPDPDGDKWRNFKKLITS